MKKPIGLPVLIKFIDAKKDLSVQVHPDDEYARTHEGGELGKTEMWYVLSAAPGASLVYGFRRDVTAAELRRRLQDGSVERDLQKVPIHKDDVFLVKAGTVHAIGAGALIVEIDGVKAVVDIYSRTSAIAGWSVVALLRNLASPVCFY